GGPGTYPGGGHFCKDPPIMNGTNGRSNWSRVTKASPCPVCKEPDWCSVSTDGAVVKCMRIADGSFRTKTDKNGTPFHLHRLNGHTSPPAPPPPRPSGPVPDRADANKLHEIYSELLKLLPLTEGHRGDLRKRGLADEVITANGYGSLPQQKRHRI